MRNLIHNTKTVMKKKIYFIALLLLALSLVGCKPTTTEEHFRGMTSQQIFEGGQKALAKQHYDQAAKYFEGLETLYPFGPYAEQAQLNLVYAYYKNNDAPSALAAADRFIHLYPQSNNVAYVFYLKGLVNFTRGQNWLQQTFNVSPAETDVTYLQQAFVDFNELVQRFPSSQYAPDARKRMIYVRNILAERELDTAQFYMRKNAYVAAIDRANYIVEHFQGSPQVIDALVIMVKANRALGLNKPADDAFGVLQMNYPSSLELRKL